MEKLLRITHTVHRDGSVTTYPDGMPVPNTVNLSDVAKKAMRRVADKLYLEKLTKSKPNKLKKVTVKKNKNILSKAS